MLKITGKAIKTKATVAAVGTGPLWAFPAEF